MTQKKLLLVAFLFYFTLALIGIVIIKYRAGGINLLILRTQKNPVKNAILGVSVGLSISFTFIILSRYIKQIKYLGREFKNILGELSTFTIIIVSLISGIAEEILFRGGVQEIFGIYIASVIFAIMHFPINKKFLLWPLFALCAGLILGFLYDYEKNIISPVLAHFVTNLVSLTFIAKLNKCN